VGDELARPTLAVEAREAIVGLASAQAHATPAEVLDVVRPHLERVRAQRVSEAPGTCPLDGQELERDPDSLDLAVHDVLAHGGGVVPFDGDALDTHGGIEALLRF